MLTREPLTHIQQWKLLLVLVIETNTVIIFHSISPMTLKKDQGHWNQHEYILYNAYLSQRKLLPHAEFQRSHLDLELVFSKSKHGSINYVN